MTSILTSEKNYPNVFCSAFPNLPNAVFRFSLTCVVFEIVGGGRKSTPPGVGVRPKPPGVRGLKAETQSSRTAQGGCGYLFKYMQVYASVCAVEISSRIVQLLRPPLKPQCFGIGTRIHFEQLREDCVSALTICYSTSGCEAESEGHRTLCI